MNKKLFILSALAIIFVAYSNISTAQNKSKRNKTVKISCEDFLTSPDKYVGQEVVIEGTAVHVCKHGGKRMFIMGEDPDERIKITTGDEIAAFSEELEGSDVMVIGVVDELRIDETYLTNWENEVMANNPDSEMKIHGGKEGHEHHDDDPDAELGQINDLRAELKESGKDHLSFYSIIASKYKEKK
ncbi:MAG: hypothetical protein B6D64_04155 [Bacteroidetes bacterium 4484_276]|nr:MAG: hypothetical protein B6D64_04155 [Bacteroidetes bacterium 4484_276]OYT14146.1 MAG: hypothetical protein B6I19_01445 [Bacteroidetes bacterium 4572_114]